MLGDHFGGDQVCENELSVLAFTGNAHRVRQFELLFSASVVLFQEVNHDEVILESDLVRLGKSFQTRHVGRGCGQGSKDGLAEWYAVQTEVCLEEKVCHIVERPFAGLI